MIKGTKMEEFFKTKAITQERKKALFNAFQMTRLPGTQRCDIETVYLTFIFRFI